MKNIVYGILVVFFCLCKSAKCQSFLEDLNAANEYFINSDQLQVQLKFELYNSRRGGKVLTKRLGSYIKQDQSYFSSSFGTQSIQDDGYQLTVDTVSRKILLQKSEKQGLGELEQLKYVIDACDTIIYRLDPSKNHLYTLDLSGIVGFEYDQVDIVLDKVDKKLLKMVFFYRAPFDPNPMDENVKPYKPRLELSFVHQEFNSPKLPTISEFVVRSGKDWILSEEYKGYKLLNNIN